MNKISNIYYSIKCYFLLRWRHNRIAKQNAESLYNLIGDYPFRGDAKKAIREGRYLDVQNFAYDHDKDVRLTQQDSIECVHFPDPDHAELEDEVKYCIEGSSEEFNSAGGAWEAWQKKRYGDDYPFLQKKKHMFRINHS